MVLGLYRSKQVSIGLYFLDLEAQKYLRTAVQKPPLPPPGWLEVTALPAQSLHESTTGLKGGFAGLQVWTSAGRVCAGRPLEGGAREDCRALPGRTAGHCPPVASVLSDPPPRPDFPNTSILLETEWTKKNISPRGSCKKNAILQALSIETSA